MFIGASWNFETDGYIIPLSPLFLLLLVLWIDYYNLTSCYKKSVVFLALIESPYGDNYFMPNYIGDYSLKDLIGGVRTFGENMY
jgi:hypothetical protein